MLCPSSFNFLLSRLDSVHPSIKIIQERLRFLRRVFALSR